MRKKQKLGGIMLSHKRMILKLSLILFLSFLLWIIAPTLQAQEDQEAAQSTPEWRKKPSFSLRLGSYFPSLSTILRVDSESLGRGTEIDLEDLLQLDSSPIVIRGDADVPIVSWCMGRGQRGFFQF